MNRPERVTVSKEMAVTHREFARAFARVVPDKAAHWDPERDGTELQFPWAGGSVRVSLGPESERRIAMMVLPRILVAMTFEGLHADETEAFLEEFDRRFRRGGG